MRSWRRLTRAGDEPRRRTRRGAAPDVGGLSRLQRHPVRAGGRDVRVLLTDPSAVPAAFTGVFMERVAGFLKLYFPVFLLGAVFGKLIELSGFSQSIAAGVIRLVGRGARDPGIVLSVRS